MVRALLGPILTPMIRNTRGGSGLRSGRSGAEMLQYLFPPNPVAEGHVAPPHPPKEGHCGSEVGGAGKAREDQPSSNPAAASPGPAARGADSSPDTVNAEPSRERSLLCPTVGRPRAVAQFFTPPKLSPSSDGIGRVCSRKSPRSRSNLA